MTKSKKAAPPMREHRRHLITTIASKGPIAMTIQEIKQAELNVGERDVLERDKERWQRLGAGAHLDEWLEFYPGLAIRRRLAMRIAFTNKPEGKGYSTALSQLYADDGFNIDDKSMMKAFTDVLWLGDDPGRVTVLREIRETMTPGQRSRLNSPISARQRVEAVLKARASGKEEKLKGSPVTLLKQRIVELERELATTREKLAGKDDGSLFDLRNDSAADIGRALADTVSEGKADAIFKASKERYKQKRQKHAG
jgi:hypothetical protein